MKRLLRSVIDFGDDQISPEALSTNFRRLRTSGAEWVRPADQKIYNYIHEFFVNNQELPSVQTIRDFFERDDDIEVAERLKDVQAAPVYVHTNYAFLLKTIIEDRNRNKMRGLLKETDEIVTKGLVVGEGKDKVRLHGTKDAMLHFTRRVVDLIPPDTNTRTRGDLRMDGEQVWADYQEAKLNKGKVWGRFTGLNEIDKVCHGLKRGELWIHAAYAGDLKTTFATSWAYNLVTRYRTNVFYVSLEMPYEQLRKILFVMHSAHAKFRAEGIPPLDYRKVRDGELDPEEEAFYQRVIEDFTTNPEYCHFEIWSPDRDVTVSDIRLETELLHKQLEVGWCCIDHGGLVEPRKKSNNYTVELNSVLRDAKKFALHFNGGEGLPVCMLFQINREGRDYAEKNEGKYKMRHLSYANEAERSADGISTSFLGEEGSKFREDGTTMFCNLKNRDNPMVPPFLAKVDFRCRKVYNFVPEEHGGILVDDPDDPLQTAMTMPDV